MPSNILGIVIGELFCIFVDKCLIRIYGSLILIDYDGKKESTEAVQITSIILKRRKTDMTFQRDLVWKNLDLVYRSSIAHQYARYALGLDYRMLPKEVIHRAKCCLLDALGCAIGAYESPGRPMVEKVVKTFNGAEESTVIGSGLRTTAMNATLVNSFLVRYLDCNDVGGGGHNSDSIPAILAVAEREKISGKDFLTSLVVSYELGGRFSDSLGRSGFGLGGFTGDLRGGLTMPPALGRMCGMNEEQIANAIGICASHALPLGILDTNKEENSMSKNFRFGLVSYDAILSCLLAKEGFTGPVTVVEGENGIRDAMMSAEFDLEKLVDFSGWRILGVRYKTLCANLSTQGHVLATLTIVKENDLKPEDIASVRVKVGLRETRHTTTLAKKYPRNAESADHSAFYANAIAIKERHFGPDAFSPEKYSDPIVLDLIEKITVELDPSLSEHAYAGTSTITTVDGRRFEKKIDVLHGFDDGPLSDAELESKFKQLTAKHITERKALEIFNLIWNLEKQQNISSLLKLMVFEEK
jgi:2-methylcitrate dehydratase